MTNDITIETGTSEASATPAMDSADGSCDARGNDEQAIIAALAAEQFVIRCGCGFLAISDSQIANRQALEEHICQGGPVRPPVQRTPTPWYGYVFSFWGVAILAIIAYAVLIGLDAVRG